MSSNHDYLTAWPSVFLMSILLCVCSENVIDEIQSKLQDIRNPMVAMAVLLREMDLETEADTGVEGAALTAGLRHDCIISTVNLGCASGRLTCLM